MIFGLCFIAGFAQNPNKELSLKILKDSNLDSVQHLALEVMKKASMPVMATGRSGSGIITLL